jgi:hypothetical protein
MRQARAIRRYNEDLALDVMALRGGRAGVSQREGRAGEASEKLFSS